MHTREPASFWRENVIVDVTLRRVFARMSWWRKQVITCWKFHHFAIWRGLTSFNRDNSANFSGGSFLGCPLFEKTRKNSSQISHRSRSRSRIYRSLLFKPRMNKLVSRRLISQRLCIEMTCNKLSPSMEVLQYTPEGHFEHGKNHTPHFCIFRKNFIYFLFQTK